MQEADQGKRKSHERKIDSDMGLTRQNWEQEA